MPNYRPPAEPAGTPAKVTLVAGTPLYRVHSARRSGDSFNPVPAHCLYGGGRFDSTSCDRYGYLYAGLTPEAAVSESVLHSLPFDPAGGARLVPRVAVTGRRLSALRLTASVDVVALVTGQDLAAVHQDSWLVQAEARDYPYTRDWAHWIRGHTDPWAQGFLWASKREPGARALVLFADRCPPGVLAPTGEDPVDFATADGRSRLDRILTPYHARLAP
ncbi:RES family NAD+ phosphorylase [Streptomyces sp. NBC_00091]|uniref:RES family NAD+ phosphorylase n=1 Tax=Streptomyces sp. NBC_00091 TaxID=2975648 RepID=UPI0022505001|nr:RES family NAD+ phosphorylase [Streptomyces sp. NBC_00091]MCX5380693.1 RES family NAD+ phosphorylase [Streptomyces sp. NBC_00091]